MKPWVELCAHGARTFLTAVFSFALWALWLALALLLVFQLYIITANELAIPDFVLRRVEARLAESGLRATFSRTSFDPSGRVLVENLHLSLPGFAEPVVSVRSVFVQLNPWLLVVGRIEPREVRFTDLTASVPAMLSPSGRPEEIIRNVDATIQPARGAFTIQQLSARVAGVTVSAHGTLMLVPAATQKPGTDTLADFLVNRFPGLCRQALEIKEQVALFDEPALHLEFAPSESGAPTIQLLVLARLVHLTKPIAAELVNVRAATRLLLFGDAPPSDVQISATEIRLPNETSAHGVQARVLGRVRTDGTQFDLREVTVTADAILAGGVEARAISAHVYPQTLPRFETTAIANVLGAPFSVQADIDLRARLGVIRFEGSVSPDVLDVIVKRLNVNARKYFDFESLAAERVEASFGPNWSFEKLSARVRIPKLKSYGITLEEGRATIELDPHRLYSPELSARIGNHFTRGSYDHNFEDNRYRFILTGRVRPLEISGWFREWWPNFFKQFEFPVGGPDVSVDVRGSWRDGRQSNVFVFADVSKPIIRGTELDRLRTRLFIRPAFFDGLEVLVTSGKGNAFGRFTYVGDPTTHAWQTLDLAADSTLDLKVAAQLLGPAGATTLRPFSLAEAPSLKVRGQFAGPDAPGGANDKLRIEARTSGEFRFHDFPLHDVSFTATINRDEIVLDDVKTLFAGGAAGGHARVWGSGAQRRLGFDFSLADASLGQVASGVGEFLAAQKGEPPAPPGKFVQEKANVRLNLSASAEGRYAEPLSYRGEGSAVLQGAEIGEVPLLGTLSELLKFTALRFTEARANFKIEGAKLVFPEVNLRGANSTIDAHGTYLLDRRELDFNAKLFPFHESGSLIKSVVGAVLTPLSNAFEVKLSGSLIKPQWAFVMGPTNFLRSLASSGDAGPKGEQGAQEKDTAPPGPPAAQLEKSSSPAARKP